MFTRRSRYAAARPFTNPPREGFAGVRPRQIGPADGVVEHTVREGDRLDLLAKHYYNDDRLWWRIVDANPDLVHGGEAVGDEMVGRVLLIPAARE